MFAYEQCLLCLGHHPDIWIEAALYLEQSSKLLTEKGVSESCNIYYMKKSQELDRLHIFADLHAASCYIQKKKKNSTK